MTNNNPVPMVPPLIPPADGLPEEGVIERDGTVQLDPDVDPDQVNSADADRIASEAADADE